MRYIIPLAAPYTLLLFCACAQIDLNQKLVTSPCDDDFSRNDSPSYGPTWELNGVYQSPMIYYLSDQKAYAKMPTSGWNFFSCATRIQASKTVLSSKIRLITGLSSITSVGLIARSQNKNTLSDGYYCALESGKLILYRGINMQRVNLATSASTYTFSAGNEYLISFSQFDNQLTCSMAGAASDSISAIDSSFASGYGGVFILVSSGFEFTFDDFKTEVRP